MQAEHRTTIYRRHGEGCEFKSCGRAVNTCNCPVWARGYRDGNEFRVSLKTRDWDKAVARSEEVEFHKKPEGNFAARKAVRAIDATKPSMAIARYPKNATAARSGAVAELIVALDLMDRGFEVFRPFHNTAFFDALAIIEDCVYRVEIKRASVSRTGRIDCEITNHGHFDILALVIEGAVKYYAASDLASQSKRPRLKGSVLGRRSFTHPPEISPENLPSVDELLNRSDELAS